MFDFNDAISQALSLQSFVVSLEGFLLALLGKLDQAKDAMQGGLRLIHTSRSAGIARTYRAMIRRMAGVPEG